MSTNLLYNIKYIKYCSSFILGAPALAHGRKFGTRPCLEHINRGGTAPIKYVKTKNYPLRKSLFIRNTCYYKQLRRELASPCYGRKIFKMTNPKWRFQIEKIIILYEPDCSADGSLF